MAQTQTTTPQQDAFLDAARKAFHDLEDNLRYSRSAKDIRETVAKIRVDLAKAGFTPGALDEAGKKTTAEMERRLRQAAANQHIRSARQAIVNFETMSTFYDKALIAEIVGGIRLHLKYAGASAAVLDEYGNSTAQQMEARIDQACVRAHLVGARKRLEKLETSTEYMTTDAIDDVVAAIQEHLVEAGADASELDKTGQSTAAEMEDRFNAAVVRMHLRSARKDFEDLDAMNVPKDKKSIEDIVKKIHHHLECAGKDASALDETGQSSKRDMEDRVKFAMAAIQPMARNAFAEAAAAAEVATKKRSAEPEVSSQRSVMEITRDMSRGFSMR